MRTSSAKLNPCLSSLGKDFPDLGKQVFGDGFLWVCPSETSKTVPGWQRPVPPKIFPTNVRVSESKPLLPRSRQGTHLYLPSSIPDKPIVTFSQRPSFLPQGMFHNFLGHHKPVHLKHHRFNMAVGVGSCFTWIILMLVTQFIIQSLILNSLKLNDSLNTKINSMFLTKGLDVKQLEIQVCLEGLFVDLVCHQP